VGRGIVALLDLSEGRFLGCGSDGIFFRLSIRSAAVHSTTHARFFFLCAFLPHNPGKEVQSPPSQQVGAR
jgi:hypothetical protein